MREFAHVPSVENPTFRIVGRQGMARADGFIDRSELEDMIADELRVGWYEIQDERAEYAGRDPRKVEDARPRTLYVRRDVRNADAILRWARGQGIRNLMPASELHVTVAFSRTPVDWFKADPDYPAMPGEDFTIPRGGPRAVEKFGDDALVLLFSSSQLTWRHMRIREDTGASWDWPDYQPHITISYGDQDVDLDEIEPYRGEIILGPEIFEEIDPNWKDRFVGEDREWDESQVERDERGRFGSGSGAPAGKGSVDVRLTRADERAFDGKSVPLQNKPSKQETGRIGEAVALAYVREVSGHDDARVLSLKSGEKATDMIGDHELIEVKAGLVSNSASAQQWRATEGQPGAAEREWRKTASAEEIRQLGEQRQQAIMDRKNALLREKSKELGVKLSGKTVATIINPDTKTVDVFEFKGFHKRIGWNSDEAKRAYKGSYKYA